MSEGLDVKLEIAIGSNNVKLVRDLLKQKADPSGDGTRSSPLRHATWNGQVHIVHMLCTAGADLNQKISYGGSLHWLADFAAYCNSEDILRYVLEHGAHYDNPAGQFKNTKAIFAQYEGRVVRCRHATTMLLSKQLRMRFGVPRDVAKLVARMVWSTRRRECWE